MRTTLTIDTDVEALLQQEIQRSHKPLKQVVNEALRRGLARATLPAPKLQIRVHDSRLRPGYDAANFHRLSDELEDEEILPSFGGRAT